MSHLNDTKAKILRFILGFLFVISMVILGGIPLKFGLAAALIIAFVMALKGEDFFVKFVSFFRHIVRN